ncbi:MAG: TatD family hydrolase [Muribaculaceae bacterium]|nr:TatD family hydrolase [Muribaculaceae bacterium]
MTAPTTSRRSIESFENIHAHGLPPGGDKVLSIRPGEEMAPEGFYSVGVHPWDTPVDGSALAAVEALAEGDARVVAIGECGLDKLRGAGLPEQEEIFEAQIAIAERLGLPLIIHCVRAQDRLLHLRRKHPGGRWILHGFRGGAASARQLLDAGIDLSFGDRYNPEAFEATPAERRFRETD